MGQGPTIQELAERDNDFRKYLEQIRGELERDKKEDIEALETLITNFYQDGGWAYQPLMTLDNVEVQQVSSWSLDNITKILTSVRNAIFGNSAPPPGVTVDKPSSFTGSLAELSNLNLLVLNRSFEAVQGILQTFATESSYKGKAITRVEVVAPGMTIFISIRSDVWRSRGFFNNDEIAQYLFIVRCFFSLEQAGDISKYNDLMAYEALKSSFRTRMLALSQTISSPSTPFSALVELDTQLGYYADQIGKIQAKIDALQKKEIEAATCAARQAFAQRSAKLIAAN